MGLDSFLKHLSDWISGEEHATWSGSDYSGSDDEDSNVKKKRNRNKGFTSQSLQAGAKRSSKKDGKGVSTASTVGGGSTKSNTSNAVAGNKKCHLCN